MKLELMFLTYKDNDDYVAGITIVEGGLYTSPVTEIFRGTFTEAAKYKDHVRDIFKDHLKDITEKLKRLSQ